MPNELVKDFGREVVIASGRGKRPHLNFKSPKVCPFCPGREHLTPPETGRVEENGDWFLRSFENKYVILSPEEGTYGKHEIIVESPDHDQKLEETDLRRYLKFCFERMEALKDDEIEYVLLFKNYGFHAGASIPHAHSQIVALPEIPPLVREEEKEFAGGFELGKKIVFENDEAMCLVPEAPRFPYEMWVAPKEKLSTSMTGSQRDAFADVLKESLLKLNKLLDAPDYCFFFHYYPEENDHFHLHLEITPRISIWAGFELGSGVLVNSIPPQVAVEELSKV